MLIPSTGHVVLMKRTSLSRRVNANSQHVDHFEVDNSKLIKKGEC